jgi:hypothetical protein
VLPVVYHAETAFCPPPILFGKSRMSPIMLRQLWNLVEATQSPVLLNLDDTSLVQWLLWQLKDTGTLDSDDASTLSTYIHSRLPLIRDIAQNRLAIR